MQKQGVFHVYTAIRIYAKLWRVAAFIHLDRACYLSIHLYHLL